MTKEAADKVKQIREYLSKMTPGPWCFDKRIRYDEGTVHYSIETVDKQPEHPWSQRFIAFMCGGLGEYVHNRKPSDYRDDPGAAQDADGICKLRTDAEWLLSQLSASEERVRDSFNEGILAASNRLGELMLHSPKHDRELLINAVLELRRSQ